MIRISLGVGTCRGAARAAVPSCCPPLTFSTLQSPSLSTCKVNTGAAAGAAVVVVGVVVTFDSLDQVCS